MNLPGFTAETSLYRTTEHYRTARAHQQIRGTVQPAQMNKLGWTVYDPNRLKCAPMKICSSLNYFCDLCTEYDEDCQPSTPYLSCIPVQITRPPINLPDPVIDKISLPKRVGAI